MAMMLVYRKDQGETKMGHSYFANGKRACDSCPRGVGRLRTCPAGWCPSCSYCKVCWEGGKKAELATWHEKCKRAAAALCEALAEGKTQAAAYEIAFKA